LRRCHLELDVFPFIARTDRIREIGGTGDGGIRAILRCSFEPCIRGRCFGDAVRLVIDIAAVSSCPKDGVPVIVTDVAIGTPLLSISPVGLLMTGDPVATVETGVTWNLRYLPMSVEARVYVQGRSRDRRIRTVDARRFEPLECGRGLGIRSRIRVAIAAGEGIPDRRRAGNPEGGSDRKA